MASLCLESSSLPALLLWAFCTHLSEAKKLDGSMDLGCDPAGLLLPPYALELL